MNAKRSFPCAARFLFAVLLGFPYASLAAQSGAAATRLLEPPVLSDPSWIKVELPGQALSLALPPDMKNAGQEGVFRYSSGEDAGNPVITALAGGALAEPGSPSDDFTSFRNKLAERLAGPEWKTGMTMYLRARLDSLKLKNRGPVYYFERGGLYTVFLRSDPSKGRVAIIALSWSAADKKASEFVIGVPAGDAPSLEKAMAILGSITPASAP